MGLTDLFLMLMLISLMGALLFLGSAIINLFRNKQAVNQELKRMLIFLGLAILCFLLFGVSL